MQQNDAEKQYRRQRLEENYRRWSAMLKVWSLCDKSKCRRLRRCSGDMRLCGLRLGEWAKRFRLVTEEGLDAAEREDLAFVLKAMERIADKWRSL